ncbi:hypothetical protein DMN91_003178, partial [Ooceraea biroi]
MSLSGGQAQNASIAYRMFKVDRLICHMQCLRAAAKGREEMVKVEAVEEKGKGAVEVGKVLFSHESRILTPRGGAISPGGAGPPASPSPGHYHPPTHSPPLVK